MAYSNIYVKPECRKQDHLELAYIKSHVNKWPRVHILIKASDKTLVQVYLLLA